MTEREAEEAQLRQYINRRLAEVGIKPKRREHVRSVMRFPETEAQVDQTIAELRKNTNWLF